MRLPRATAAVAFTLATALTPISVVAAPAATAAPTIVPASTTTSPPHSDPGLPTEEVTDLPLDDDGAARVTQQDEVLVAPGLELTRFTRLEADGRLSGQILVAHLGTGVRAGYIGPERAPGLPVVAGGATVTGMASARGAVAAINGDYFDIGHSGAALGAAVDGGTLLKSAIPGRERSAVFGPDGTGRLAELFLDGTLTWTTADDAGAVPLSGLNVTALPTGGAAVYDAAWGSFTRSRALHDGETGVEARIAASGTVTAVGPPGTGQLGDDERAVVARPGEAADALAALTPGDRVEIDYELRDDAAGGTGEVEVAVGGGAEDWLLEDGEVTTATGSHVESRHPRTAVGFGPDGRIAYFVVVDGRQAGSIGMDLYELGELFAQLGAKDAINLDGGGSSQMVARLPGDADTSILNSPSDGHERYDANGIGLFVPAGSGRLHAYDVRTTVPADDADRVFPGLRRTLVAKGYDEVMHPVGTPPTAWHASSAAARVSARLDGTAVVTGAHAGRARITARHLSGGGTATGSMSVRVLGPLVRTAVGTPVVALDDAAATAPLVLTGYDADGSSAPVEAWDVVVTGDKGAPVAELVPADDGSFTVTALRGSGTTSFTLSVETPRETVTSRVTVSVGESTSHSARHHAGSSS